jgi:nucleotidyltransferase AbiEii toxin of type IV toxin-antitoxin system
LSLQREAKATRRTTAEYLRLYALEGFLLRLARSPHRNRFILKGGVLLAAYGLRRPTTDIDGAALQTSNRVEDIRQFVTAVASTQPAEIWLPRLLGQEPIQLRGYSMEMVLAEKTVTALQRGSANTRWRDFGDIFVITGRLAFKAGEVRQALQAVADYLGSRSTDMGSYGLVSGAHLHPAQPVSSAAVRASSYRSTVD